MGCGEADGDVVEKERGRGGKWKERGWEAEGVAKGQGPHIHMSCLF